MKLYNTATHQIEDFTPANPDEVKIYTCGPTVYSFAHIGNFTSYAYWDLLIRVLRLNGWQEKRVLNITDVGHLTSDADDGEDKMEKGARREGKTVWEVAQMYMDDFLENFHALGLIEPYKICRATDYIKEDIEFIQEDGFYDLMEGSFEIERCGKKGWGCVYRTKGHQFEFYEERFFHRGISQNRETDIVISTDIGERSPVKSVKELFDIPEIKSYLNKITIK